jgi:hypothetical protein
MQADIVFHPEQLIPLVHAQHPLRRDVIRALQLCNAGEWVSNKIVQLVAEVKEQAFREQLIVQTDETSSMILYVLADGRIGRIQFI